MTPTSAYPLRVPHFLCSTSSFFLPYTNSYSDIMSLRYLWAVIIGALFLFGASAADCTALEKPASLCDISYPSDRFLEWKCVQLKPNDTPWRLFGDNWEDGLRFNRIDRRHFRAGTSIKVPLDPEEIEGFSPMPATYPDAEEEEKFILVDLSEMFLGAYEFGELVDSFPVSVGMEAFPAPTGDFRIDAVDPYHESNLYMVEELEIPYPMHYGMRFHLDRKSDGWPSYWIHGRDLPGYPASHGCIGLYDEEMQNDYYSDHDRTANNSSKWMLKKPYLRGAEELYLWVLGGRSDPGTFSLVDYGPRVRIIGVAPSLPPSSPP